MLQNNLANIVNEKLTSNNYELQQKVLYSFQFLKDFLLIFYKFAVKR